MHVTPEHIRGAYVYLGGVPPMDKWGLPDADDVSFRVTNSKTEIGACKADAGGFIIEVSCRLVSHSYTLLRVVAHEMCHVRADMLGEKSCHGRLFQAAKRQVAKEHGMDPHEL